MKNHFLPYCVLLTLISPISMRADNYVIINQVMYDARSATASVSNGEYIELYNAGQDTVSLDGWQITGDGATEKKTFSGIKIPNGEYLIVACRRGDNTFQLDNFYSMPPDTNYQIVYQNKIMLANTGETITLVNAQNDTIDRMYYDGESHVSNPSRLYATNFNGCPADSCVSLHRTWVEFDAEGKVVQSTSQWMTDRVSFALSMLPDDTYHESYIIGNQSLPMGENYILSITPIDPVSRIDINNGRISLSSGIRTRTSLQYLDGLGRPDEMISIGITPGKNDLVSITDYLGKRKTEKQWLPIVMVSEGQKMDIATVRTQAQEYYDSNRPYYGMQYENSSRRREIARARPGYGQMATKEYGFNSENDQVRIYTVNKSDTLHADGTYYNTATLYKTIVSDEDGKSVTTYTDKHGCKIMEERAGKRTYYVYDDLGRLRFVLPHIQLSKLNNGKYALSDSTLRRTAYCYRYDDRGNMIYKRLPGSEPQYMVYDQAGQLILKQDGNQRALGKWTMCTYDSLGRNLYIAEIGLTETHEELIDSMADRWYVEHYGNNPSNISISGTGYASSVFSKRTLRLLALNYYDGYHYLSRLETPVKNALSFDPVSAYGLKSDNTEGLLTGTRVYCLEEDSCYTAVSYFYDVKGRVIQSRTCGKDRYKAATSTEYLFDGSVAQQQITQGTDSGIVQEHYRYTYDHAGRAKKLYYQLNNDEEIILSAFSYDSLGRLVQNLLHSGKDTIHYSYDMRNMLTETHNKHFSERLFYAENLPLGVAACHNGNISAARIVNVDTTTFAYTYDSQNRLLFSNLLTEYGLQYSESFTYDDAGNVLALRRYNNNQLIDDLNYDYGSEGNQLLSVIDGGEDANLYSTIEYHNDGIQSDTTMRYDANSNLIYDADRGIVAVHYNILNLPDTIQFINGNQIVNLYDAVGTKYKSIVYTTPPTAVAPQYEIVHYTFGTDTIAYLVTEYAGNIETVYTKTDTLTQRIHNATGYYADSTYYHYIKDHLGNICAVVNSARDSVVQRTAYYASGVPMPQSVGRDKQPYLYNGKEFVEAHGLNTYDYGFRGYYAPIGRFTSVDPLAEQTPWQSPYAYAGNKFVNAIDWMGLGGMTVFSQGVDICQYIVIDSEGNFLGGIDDDDDGIYLDSDGNWKPIDGKKELELVGRMIFPFGWYDWMGKGHKAPGFYFDNRYTISVSLSIGWQVSVEGFTSLSCPSIELFNISNSFGGYYESSELVNIEVDYLGNNYEYKTTLGIQAVVGYDYSTKHNVRNDVPVNGSFVQRFSLCCFNISSDGTIGITYTFALIGGISISITGNLYYENNE